MSLVKSGIVLLLVGAAGAGVNLWARETFPSEWGGPNIGGGMLQMLFYGAILAGLIMTVIGSITARRNRS